MGWALYYCGIKNSAQTLWNSASENTLTDGFLSSLREDVSSLFAGFDIVSASHSAGK